MVMFGFLALAFSMPFHAAALKDLSSRPPWSVTMQAVYALPVGLAAVPPFSLGFSPHADAARVRPPAATRAMNLIPRAGRKTHLLPHRPGAFLRAGSISGSVTKAVPKWWTSEQPVPHGDPLVMVPCPM
ncbi:hypothetical protein GCM10009682_46690 [Luedemannella flava]|uniref:NADH dehydrogenase subunit 6 n=1 Tax=Luedemannella flava TaxID=349316 RepID=A0ABP4YLV7_9ACTN